MKWLLLILSSVRLLSAASIDTALFEGDDRKAYYQQMQEQIATSEKSGLVDKETLHREHALLTQLRAIVEQQVTIEPYDLKRFAEPRPITEKTFFNAIVFLADVRDRLDTYRQTNAQLQSKLSYTKQKIENITEEEKSNLLAYQLQFAFYKVQQKVYEQKISLLQIQADAISAALKSGIKRVTCGDTAKTDAALTASDTEIEQLGQKRIAVEIQREQAQFDESKPMEQIQQKLTDIDTAYDRALSKKIALQMGKAVCLLKLEKNKPFFALFGEMEAQIKMLSKEARGPPGRQKEILRDLAKSVFGSTRLFLGATKQEIGDMWTAFKGYATATLFVFNEHAVNIISLGKALFLIIFSFILGSMYKRWIGRVSRRWPDMSQMSIRLTANIGSYVIIIVGTMIAISSIGIDMTSISLIAGALSIGIGFGLQTVVSNFIAGIIMMFERTIRIGDTIEISDTLLGRVADVRIRSTTIKTFDNIDIVVPNSSFIQNNVINWTLEDTTRRLRIPFGVAYGTDVDLVKKVVLEELAQSDLRYIHTDPDKMPDVWMVAMNSSSVDFELLVWIVWANRLRPNALKSDFLILIYKALNKHGIQIPFPQLDLHVKDLPKGVNHGLPEDS